MTYTRSENKNKTLLLQSATAEQIQQHTEDIRQGLASSVVCRLVHVASLPLTCLNGMKNEIANFMW